MASESSEDPDMQPSRPPPLEVASTQREGMGTSVRRKSAVVGNTGLVRAGHKPNLTAAEATSQLKVLCRKFAALTEKVKEESKIREAAEKEVRRLEAIIEANVTPVIASCRAESQSFLRDLKDAHESLKQDLRSEKEKNAKLVRKALELEREKSALLAATSAPASVAQHSEPQSSDQSSYHVSRHDSAWDREQTTKINDALRMTIDELQDELTRREDELSSYRERLQRERARVKSLELELQEREEASREEQTVLKQLEANIQEQRDQFEAIEKEMQATAARLEEEANMRQTLEQQIEMLNDVNAALEQRAQALVRRLELSHSLVGEIEELKYQVRDVEVDKETLVRSIKDVKEQQFLKETQWKAQLEQLRSEKLTLAAQIVDLQSEITSLRTQNSMFSEWMLVRSENVAVAQQQQQQRFQRTHSHPDDQEDHQAPRVSHLPHRSTHSGDPYSASNRSRLRPLASHDGDNHVYAHTSARCPLSPSKTRSMTTASPIRQAPIWLESSRRTSIASSASSSDDRTSVDQRRGRKSVLSSQGLRMGEAGKPTLKPAFRIGGTQNKTASKLSDHERLRELMSRNRELQNRLQLETVATRNLEQEITHITTQRTNGAAGRTKI